MLKKTIKDIDLKGKRIVIRVDYNVTVEDGFTITDDTRIKQTIPTLSYLLGQNCSLVIISHLGRPKGKVDPRFTLEPVAKHLEKMIGKKVHFFAKYLDPQDQEKIKKLKKGEIAFLENLRFHKGEEGNSPEFAEKLANLGEIFVNDGFGVSHRAHASTVGITQFLPSVAGLLLEKEVDMISKALYKPKRPLVSIIGGAKTETKINLIDKLMEKSDSVLLGGCIANTFLKAWGYETGKSKIDYEAVETARSILWKASRQRVSLMLPSDVVLGDLKLGIVNGVVEVDKINPELQALDIGPKTKAEFGHVISRAGTIVWNGPMGVAEKKEYSRGTEFIFFSITQNKEAITVVGGGDTLASLQKKEYLSGVTHLSTGGGAMLEFIEKGSLPGIDALQDK